MTFMRRRRWFRLGTVPLLFGAVCLAGGAAPPDAAVPMHDKYVVNMGDYRLQLMSARATASYDGLRNEIETVLEIMCDVAGPTSLEATPDALGVRPGLRVTVLEDEHGRDLLTDITANRLGKTDFWRDPFEASYRQRSPWAADPERTLVFRKPVSLVGSPGYQPRGLRRVVGTVEIVRPRGVRMFDFDPLAADAASHELRELVPGLWMAVSGVREDGHWVTNVYCWQCNRVRPELEGKPAWPTLRSIEAVPPPPPAHRRGRGENVVGHDFGEPPALVGILAIDEDGKPLESGTFSMTVLDARASGVYSTMRYVRPVVPNARRVRVAVATEFERVEVPFEFLDVPLAWELPGEPRGGEGR